MILREERVRKTPQNNTLCAGFPARFTDVWENPLADRRRLADFWEDHLFGHILPFWEKYAFDELGGINTMLRDDGQLLGTDKWLWGQFRAIWVFSKIYNTLDPDPRWLKYAEHIYRFATAHGWDAAGDGWALRLSREGAIITGAESIYTDAFALCGLTELARALDVKDGELAVQVEKTANAVIRKLKRTHDRIPHAPYPVPPGARVHGIPMLFSQTFGEAGFYWGNEDYLQISRKLSAEVFEKFYRPDRDCLIERIREDGSEMPAPLGTAVVPGHVIEDMWFQLQLEENFGSTHYTDLAVRMIRRHLELGWDPVHGGLFLAVDADGGDNIGWDSPRVKLWWPQTEALQALTHITESQCETWVDEWYTKLFQLSMTSFCNWDAGEWYQRLSHDLVPFDGAVVFPVKDPFHLTRSVIMQILNLRKS
ncbi:MAG: AGE family epimerase/isomerase [Kiritimatiellales bacterium]